MRFIFDDDIPQIDFYTVLFAKDSFGGLFGTVGQTTDIHDTASNQTKVLRVLNFQDFYYIGHYHKKREVR